MRKRVLIICSYFPPTLNGGSKRPYLMAKELESKFNVTVITLQNEVSSHKNNFKIESLEYWKKNLKSTLSKIIFEFFFKFGLVSANDFYIQKQVKKKDLGDFDIVIGTYPELVNLLLAQNFKRKNPNCKLIIDFRDGLMQESLKNWNFFQKKALLKFERKICVEADHIITVGESISNYFKRYCQNVTTIYNSHELNSDSKKNVIKKDNVIKFIHFGSLSLSKKRNLSNFIEALVILKNENNFNFIIDFVGNISIDEKKMFELYDLNDIVRFQNAIPRNQRKLKFSNYDFGLLIGVEGQKTYISSKLFDYIEFKLPILSVCKGNEVEKIIKSNKFGMTCDFNTNSIINCFKSSISTTERFYINYENKFSSKFQMRKLGLLCLDI